jgi:hypothetical protein
VKSSQPLKKPQSSQPRSHSLNPLKGNGGQSIYQPVKIPTGRFQQGENLLLQDMKHDGKSLSPTKEPINIINEIPDESSQEGRCTSDARSDTAQPPQDNINI